MNIDVGFSSESAKTVESQYRFLKTQYDDEVPAKAIKIRCPCLKLVPISRAYHCLYCGVFFCKECAEKHFGKTVDEYNAEKIE
ncbi:hypothetical protein [Methylophaga lonarensis]|uniref:hypothetical protein n=1 Tax=Methylophaga lonarensis TaxID=999151 RepID=UPI003D2D6575